MGGAWRRLRGSRRSGRAIFRRARAGLLVAMIGANLVGAAVVTALSLFVISGVPLVEELVLVAGYVALAVPFGILRGTRRFREVREWMQADRVPTPRQQLTVLRGPLRLTLVMAALWGTAVVLFGTLNFVRESPLTGVKVALIVAFGGITTCAIAYLLAERVLREAAVRALEASEEARRVGLGVAWRSVLTWALATGVPVLGIVLFGVAALIGRGEGERAMALAMVILGGVVLLFGLLATIVAARATADPIVAVRRALAQVEAGDLDTRVPVYDGTEVGLLQAGFNRMVAGLRERERLRDLFGRHVGEDVARTALERGVELGGEVRDVAALFVDVVGSTTLAARRPPEEVVGVLNAFFAVVVDVVEARGGSVNKFEGDAALALFGAPAALDDHATCALSAARELAGRLADELPETCAAIGVSGGPVVVGNVGAEHRFEYTAIGDAVNEAARLSEIAKGDEPRLVASGALVDRAAERERGHWRQVDEVVLRGRDEPTCVFAPV